MSKWCHSCRKEVRTPGKSDPSTHVKYWQENRCFCCGAELVDLNLSSTFGPTNLNLTFSAGSRGDSHITGHQPAGITNGVIKKEELQPIGSLSERVKREPLDRGSVALVNPEQRSKMVGLGLIKESGFQRFLFWLFVFGFGVFLLVSGVRYLEKQRTMASDLRAFDEYLNEYRSVHIKLVEHSVKYAYIKRKVLPIDRTTNKVDDIYLDLPDPLRATRPSEVKSLIFLEWETRATHSYRNGATGYSYVCKLEIVDLSLPALVAKTELLGPYPPKTIPKSQREAYGARPKDLVLATLARIAHVKYDEGFFQLVLRKLRYSDHGY